MRTAAIAAVLAAVTAAAYWPVLDCGFVNYDDDFHITKNEWVQTGLTAASLRWAFTTFATSNWHPVTWVSHILDYVAYGLDPWGHHLTSLLIHCVNAVLLFVLLSSLTGKHRRAALAAALFALHPLHVESVAWVSERKDVLSTMFGLLSLLAYKRYAARRAAVWYCAVVGLFALALMSKPMLVSLPVLMLLLDYWPLGRLQRSASADSGAAQQGEPVRRYAGCGGWGRLMIEKIPLFFLAAGSCVVTWIAQRAGSGAAGQLGEIPLGVRLDNAAVSCIAYLGKMLWPARLAVIYPHPLRSIPAWQVAGAVVLLACFAAAAVALRRSRPYVFVGWWWYVVALIPVIGLVQVGEQGMADRYTYIPLIGIFTAVVWGLGDLLRTPLGSRLRPVIAALSLALLGVLAGAVREQVGCWRDSETLFARALSVTQDNYVAHLNLAVALEELGKTEPARQHYEQALRLRPDWPEALYNYAAYLAKNGEASRAIGLYTRAVRSRPGYVDAHYNLGVLYDSLGRTRDAVREYEAVVRLAPGHAQAHNNLAVAYYSLGRYAKAWRHVHAAAALGFQPHPGFIRALSVQMPEPD